MSVANLKNNTSMYYELISNIKSKDTLILIPGLTGDVSAFGNIIPRLKKYFNILAIDNRGVGRTVSDSASFSVENMAEDVILLMDFLGLKNVNVLGHSMGGYIAEVLAADYSEQIKKIILSCSAAGMSENTKKNLVNIYSERKKSVIPTRDFNEKFLENFSSPVIYNNDFLLENILNFMEEYPFKQSLQGFKEQMNACLNFEYSRKLESITKDTLIIAGEIDEVATVKEVMFLKENIRNSKLEIMKNTGHLPYVENSKLYVDIVLKFLL